MLFVHAFNIQHVQVCARVMEMFDSGSASTNCFRDVPTQMYLAPSPINHDKSNGLVLQGWFLLNVFFKSLPVWAKSGMHGLQSELK